LLIKHHSTVMNILKMEKEIKFEPSEIGELTLFEGETIYIKPLEGDKESTYLEVEMVKGHKGIREEIRPFSSEFNLPAILNIAAYVFGGKVKLLSMETLDEYLISGKSYIIALRDKKDENKPPIHLYRIQSVDLDKHTATFVFDKGVAPYSILPEVKDERN